MSTTTTVTKRDGRVVPFDPDRISNALQRCFARVGQPDYDVQSLSKRIFRTLKGKGLINPSVEVIQDIVETTLQGAGEFDAAKHYILYRAEHAKLREERPIPEPVRWAFDESAKYFPTPIQQFQFFDKYARFNEDMGRRETWLETTDRAISFLHELAGDRLEREVYERIRQGILDMKALPSMRLLAMAGEAARRSNITMYNCAYLTVIDPESFVEALILSMSGTGVGFSVERQFTEELPRVKRQIPERYKPTMVIEDSSEGWAEALRAGLYLWFDGGDITFDYSLIRPFGAPLRVKGGRASGPEPLRQLLNFARDRILRRQGSFLRPIDAHDMMCAVGNAAVSGGVRRCLPTGTRVHTKRGAIPIEEVVVGDLVMTDTGYKSVTGWLDQGIQDTIEIVTESGTVFRCTPNHRVAVSVEQTGGYTFKEAGKLNSDDQLIFVATPIEGEVQTVLPYQYSLETTISEEYWRSSVKVRLALLQSYFIGGRCTGLSEHLARDLSKLLATIGVQSNVSMKISISLSKSVYSEWSVSIHDPSGVFEFTHCVPIRIENIRNAGPAPTYDIEVQDGGVFVAEGYLVHNSAMISLFDYDDDEMRNCKSGDFERDNNQRWNANNSAVWPDRRMSQREIAKFMLDMDDSQRGEPGIFNRMAANANMPPGRKRNSSIGVNPCGEIILQDRSFCNLSISVARHDDTYASLREKVELATIIGTIQSMATHFPGLRPKWKENCEEERLLGVDITGHMDSPVARDPDHQLMLRSHAITTNIEYAALLSINQSASLTTVKPSGNSGQLLNCSSGMHARWAPYYIRNLRVGGNSPMYKVLRDAGVPMDPENGQYAETATVWVAHFPVKSPEGATTRHDLTALQQLDYWLQVKTHWTTHNPSQTISYNPDEVLDIINWVWRHQSQIGGLSFLPNNDARYEQMPYVEITKEEYEKLAEAFPKIDFAKLTRYEQSDHTTTAQELSCSAGLCEV